MIARGQLANHSFYGLLLIIKHWDPALNMSFFNDVEEVSDVAGPHDDLSLVVPLRLQAIKQGKLLVLVKVVKDIHSVEESHFGRPLLLDRFDDNLFENCTVKDPNLAV